MKEQRPDGKISSLETKGSMPVLTPGVTSSLSQYTTYRQCPHGYHHPPWLHSCDGCWCEGERDRREYGWDHDTTPKEEQ